MNTCTFANHETDAPMAHTLMGDDTMCIPCIDFMHFMVWEPMNFVIHHIPNDGTRPEKEFDKNGKKKVEIVHIENPFNNASFCAMGTVMFEEGEETAMFIGEYKVHKKCENGYCN